MFKTIFNFMMRILFCTFTFHSASDTPVQSHKEYHVFACSRCGNLYCKKKIKYQKK